MLGDNELSSWTESMLGTKWEGNMPARQVSISTIISGRGKVQSHHVAEEGGKVSIAR